MTTDSRADRPAGQRIAGLLDNPERRRVWARATKHALSIAGIVSIAILAALYWKEQNFGFDARSYWGFDMSDLYRGTSNAEGLGPYRYAPVWAQALGPLSALPWWQFLWLWTALLVGTLTWLGRSWTLALCVFPLIPVEIGHGNIHLLLAAAVVLGFRHPWTWALVVLTKVTPGIGLLWFVARREWRQLAIVLGATLALVAVSMALGGVDLWWQWARSLADTPAATGANHVALPLLVRLPLAAALTIWAARTDRAWLLPVAVMLALPTIWFHSFSMLAGSFALLVTWRALAPERLGGITSEAAPAVSSASG